MGRQSLWLGMREVSPGYSPPKIMVSLQKEGNKLAEFYDSIFLYIYKVGLPVSSRM